MEDCEGMSGRPEARKEQYLSACCNKTKALFVFLIYVRIVYLRERLVWRKIKLERETVWGGGALLVVADEVGMDIYIYIPCYRSGT